MNSEKLEATEAEESEPIAGSEESPERVPVRSKSRGAVEIVQQDSDSEQDEEADPPDTEDGGPPQAEDQRRPQGYWGYNPRPTSQMGMAEETAVTPAPAVQPPARSKSRMQSAKDLSYWRARRVVFYKNGDPYFPGVEFRFKPGRDIGTMEALLDKVSLRVDLPRGARYIFTGTGARVTHLEQLEDGGAYVVSSYKVFKVRSLQ
jgi:microtubule-associated protein-like 1/2